MQAVSINITKPGYKLSRYNFFIAKEDGTLCGYNFLYKACVLFNEKEYAQLQSNTCSNALVDYLCALQFLIPDDLDEWEYYQYHYTRWQHVDNGLSLSVMPSLGCNLSCPYCYEKKNGAVMSDETQQHLVDWVRSNMMGKQSLHVDWFGGEPLLQMNSVIALSNQFMQICEQNGVNYSASVTTNGTLLTTEVIDQLNSLHVYSVQITLDGDKTTHNRQKYFHNGDGTFDTLLKHMVSYCEQGIGSLRIRVNVSDENFDSIEAMLHSIPEKVRQQSVIFFRWLYPTHQCEYATQKQADNPYHGLYQLQQKAIQLGFHWDNQYDQLRLVHCEADNPSFFTIDPLGNIYTCVHDYVPENAIGSVHNPDDFRHANDFYRFRNASVLNDEECKQCLVLPICHGGCRRARMLGKKQCIYEKQSPELYVDMACSTLSKQENQPF